MRILLTFLEWGYVSIVGAFLWFDLHVHNSQPDSNNDPIDFVTQISQSMFEGVLELPILSKTNRIYFVFD